MSWCPSFHAAAFVGATLGAALGAAPGAIAAELTWGGSTASSAEHTANPALTVPQGASAWRFSQSLSADLQARGEIWEAVADGALSINRSTQRGLNTVDGSFGARFRRRFELGSVGLAGVFRRDSTLASEFQTTGIALARAQRDSTTVSATGTYALGERLSASAGGSLGASRYDRSGGATGLIDSDTQSASASLNYTLGPRSTFGVTASVSRYDTQPFTTQSKSASVQATLLHNPTERLSLNAAYGPSRTRTEIAGLARICPLPQFFCDTGVVPFTVFPTRTRQLAAGYLFNVSAVYQAGPATQLTLSAGRAANASGSGFLVETDSLSGALNHQLGARLTLGLDAGATSADSIPAASRLRTQRMSAVLNWQLAEAWSLESGMRWQRAEFPGAGAPASRALFVGLRYGPPRQSVTKW